MAKQKTKVQEGEVVDRKSSAKTQPQQKQYVFRPLAGFWLLYFLAFIGIVTTLDGRDYDTLPERIFWAVITLGLIIGIQKHWPAMRQLIVNRVFKNAR